jgi:hypothetical protein
VLGHLAGIGSTLALVSARRVIARTSRAGARRALDAVPPRPEMSEIWSKVVPARAVSEIRRPWQRIAGWVCLKGQSVLLNDAKRTRASTARGPGHLLQDAGDGGDPIRDKSGRHRAIRRSPGRRRLHAGDMAVLEAIQRQAGWPSRTPGSTATCWPERALLQDRWPGGAVSS